jgi:hypothetical protein
VPHLFVALRILALAAATMLLAAGGVLGYVAVVALRRSEGVFLPAGYVAIGCLMAGLMLGRAVLRW